MLMEEIIDKGCILERTSTGEHDALLSVFTRQHGKIRLRAQSILKQEARLGGILQPLRFVQVRYIQTPGTVHKLVDAVLDTTFQELHTYKRKDLLPMLQCVEYITFNDHQDGQIWFFLQSIFSHTFSMEEMARALWKVEGGNISFPHRCCACQKRQAEVFVSSQKNVSCHLCAKEYDESEIIPLSFFNSPNEVR